jgi:hypothetical protein
VITSHIRAACAYQRGCGDGRTCGPDALQLVVQPQRRQAQEPDRVVCPQGAPTVHVADLDGDGRPEVLVAAEDGRLYCLKGDGGGP